MNFLNKDELSKYDTSSDQFSSWQLRLGHWYLDHKSQVKKWLIGILVVWNIVTLGGSLFYWGYYFSSLYFYDQKVSQRVVRNFQNYAALQKSYQARAPQVKSVKVVKAQGKDKYNIAADVFNPNQRWVADINYHFQLAQGKTSQRSAIILPGRQQPLTALGVGTQATQGVNFSIDNINWRSIDPHRISNIKKYTNARLNFQLSDTKFTPANEQTDIPASITITIKNPTAYSYWSPDFTFKMFNGGKLVRIKTARVKEFISGTTREITFTFSDPNIKVTEVKMFSHVNIFQADEFMPPSP